MIVAYLLRHEALVGWLPFDHWACVLYSVCLCFVFRCQCCDHLWLFEALCVLGTDKKLRLLCRFSLLAPASAIPQGEGQWWPAVYLMVIGTALALGSSLVESQLHGKMDMKIKSHSSLLSVDVRLWKEVVEVCVPLKQACACPPTFRTRNLLGPHVCSILLIWSVHESAVLSIESSPRGFRPLAGSNSQQQTQEPAPEKQK